MTGEPIEDYVYPLDETSFMVQTPEEWKIWDTSQSELRSFPEPLPASARIFGVNQGIVYYDMEAKPLQLMSAQENLHDYLWKEEDGLSIPLLPSRNPSPVSYKGRNYWGLLCYRKEGTVHLYIQLHDLRTFERIHKFEISAESM